MILPEALSAADHVVLADIYAARETDTLGISSSMLAEKIAGLEQMPGISPAFQKLKNFFWKMWIRRPVDNYGGRRYSKSGENLLKK